ncbi:MAG: ATP-binding protein, partial [Candidatus Dormibacteraeota bacterium]|nr:ATP-binding protein [Candidatus Dormibacteraeota bacterium]
WRDIGIPEPGPFADATFYVPQQLGAEAAEQRGREALPYSWGLEDLIERNLFPYIFAEDDREDDNFAGLLSMIERMLARERIEEGRVVLRMLDRDKAPNTPRTLSTLTDWVGDQLDNGLPSLRNQHHGTVSKLYRRLLRIVQSGSGVLRVQEPRGHPLDVTATETVPPRVVDIAAIGDAGLQRFVVGAIVRQIADARVGPRAVRGLRYLLMLDELNRWAPRGARDPITKLIERVAAEMRSQGVVLLGAQQQASQVSEKVIEAAAIRMLGRTGSLELEQTVWKSVPPAFRRLVTGLRKEEKVVLTPSARQPMIIRMPCPAWAMNQEDVAFTRPVNGRLPRTERED